MYLEKEQVNLHKTAKNYLTFSNIFVIHMGTSIDKRNSAKNEKLMNSHNI
ncbi:hypothetical protein OIU78_001556 [Salix suchowensis]|nr:hypothetical protein OIU78_001556 [Salix suchowensis]